MVTAIAKAEEYLQKEGSLYCLGAIVHNNLELERLRSKGLRIVDSEQLYQLNNTHLLIRAHGEPPTTYALAKERNLTLIDCTCPVVLKLQKTILETYQSLKRGGGQIVIFGKKGHAEVNGLVGQTEGNALVVENLLEVEKAFKSGTIDPNSHIELFSQTTKDPQEYLQIGNYIKSMISSKGVLSIHNSICRQVSSRHSHLTTFSQLHSIIIFVSGSDSSNGKILFDLCKKANPRSYMVEGSHQIKNEWFKETDSVGVCGATSTPRWQLEDIALYLDKIYTHK